MAELSSRKCVFCRYRRHGWHGVVNCYNSRTLVKLDLCNLPTRDTLRVEPNTTSPNGFDNSLLSADLCRL